MDELKANDYTLSISRYVDPKRDLQNNIDINELKAEIEAMDIELAALDKKIKDAIAKLEL